MEDLFKGLEDLVSGKSPQNFMQSQEGLEGDLFKKPEEPKKTEEKPDGDGISVEEMERLTGGKPAGKADDEDGDEPEPPAKPKAPAADDSKGDDDKDEKDEKGDDDKVTLYKGISAFLKEEGILEGDEEFDSPDKMKEVFGNLIKSEVDQWKDSLPDEIKDIINNYEDGVPFDELIQTKSEMIRYNSIDTEKLEENEDLQKAIYAKYLQATTKYSDEKIQREIKRLADLDELKDEAASGLQELKEIEKEREEQIKIQAKKQQEAYAKEREAKIQELNTKVKGIKEIIPGVKVSDKEAADLFKMLTTPVEIRGEEVISSVRAAREKDPDGFDIKLNYFIKKGFFDGKFDEVFKKAETKVVKDVVSSVESAAARLQAKGGYSGKASNPNGSKTEELLTAMGGLFKNRE